MSSSTKSSIVRSLLLPGWLMLGAIALTVTVDASLAQEPQKLGKSPRLAEEIKPKPDSAEPAAPPAIPEWLIQERIVIISQEITDELAELIISQLLYLDAQTPGEDIYLYINSPGGEITSGLAIYDTMKSLQSNVVTVSLGQASSMGSFLLAGGTKGKRLALPNVRIMIHQASGGTWGQATDVAIEAKELLYLKQKLNQMLADFTGQPLTRIEKDTDRDFYMSAQEAKAYGIVDRVVDRLPSVSRPLKPQ